MATIKEDYVSFETAKLLKEKGFNVSEIDAYFPFVYYSDGKMDFYDDDKPLFVCEAVTHQMAIKWLREVHNIFIEIGTSIDLNGNYHFNYTILDKECKYIRRGCTNLNWNYEEASETAIRYCLEHLI